MQNENSLFNEFIRHLFPRMVRRQNLKITYTFCLGGLAFTAFIVLMATGLLLLFYYQPSSEGAFGSILFLESSVPAGLYVRSLHRLASHAFLVLIFLHTLRVILTGAFRKPRELNWIIGFFLLCLALFEAYTGYLLPMDQFAVMGDPNRNGTHQNRSYWKTGCEYSGAGRYWAADFSAAFLHSPYCHYSCSVLLLSFLHFYRIRQNKEVLPYL